MFVIFSEENMSKKKSIILTVVITFFATVLLCALASKFFPSSTLDYIQHAIKHKYIGEYDEAVTEAAAARAMVDSLKDPYSNYLTKEDFDSIMHTLDSNYEGIGIEVYIDPADNLLTVQSAIEGSPAYNAGIKSGDKILKVDNIEVSAENYTEVISYIKGLSQNKGGAEMTFVIKRAGTDRLDTLKISRSTIKLKTVSNDTVDGVPYIRISGFDSPTFKEFEDCLDKIDLKNAPGLIIDVRDNPGGLITSVSDVTDRILKKATIVYTQDSKGSKKYYKSTNAEYIDIPMVVLINENSASASEIFAAALKDNGAAIIIGTKSFGKGCVQQLIKFPAGDGIKLTTAYFYSPSDVCIQGAGVTPDIEVRLPDEVQNKSISLIPFEKDAQLQKAIEILK